MELSLTAQGKLLFFLYTEISPAPLHQRHKATSPCVLLFRPFISSKIDYK